MRDEKTLKEQVVFRGPFFLIREHEIADGRGGTRRRLVLEHPGAACAIPLLPDGRVIMVRQYRKAVEAETLEFPAGKLEPGEELRKCLERELAEEIGQCPGRLERMISYYPAFGYSDEVIHIFLARDLRPVEKTGGDEIFIETVTMPLEEILRMIESGEIMDSKTIIGALLLRQRREA